MALYTAAACVVAVAAMLLARRAFCPALGGVGRGMLAGAADEQALGSTWASAVEVMLSERAVGENVFMTPATSRPSTSGGALPPFLRSHRVFALTAFDPPGEARTLEDNTAANGRLWREIKELKLASVAVWPTWGYNLDEGWREDGFGIAFPLEPAAAATQRQAIVNLAKRFGQGAIFEFAPGETHDSMRRTTVPALSSETVREVVTMWRIPRVPVEASPLLERPWAGPPEAL